MEYVSHELKQGEGQWENPYGYLAAQVEDYRDYRGNTWLKNNQLEEWAECTLGLFPNLA